MLPEMSRLEDFARDRCVPRAKHMQGLLREFALTPPLHLDCVHISRTKQDAQVLILVLRRYRSFMLYMKMARSSR